MSIPDYTAQSAPRPVDSPFNPERAKKNLPALRVEGRGDVALTGAGGGTRTREYLLGGQVPYRLATPALRLLFYNSFNRLATSFFRIHHFHHNISINTHYTTFQIEGNGKWNRC